MKRHASAWMLLAAAVTILSLLRSWALPQEANKNGEWKTPLRATRKKNPVAADDKSVARGRTMFSKRCAKCHGASGHGEGIEARELDLHPTDLTIPKFAEQSDGAIFWKVSEGRNSMPSFENLLKEDERWDLVNYMRTLAAPKNAAPNKATYK